MPNSYQIKTTVQFPERTAIPKEQSENVLFDIVVEEVNDNTSYCKFSDVVSLKWEHFNEKEQRITKEIRKTRRTHNFKIGQMAIDILNQYKTEISEPTDFVFPIIEDVELFDANEEYQAHIINAKNILCGQKLRRIGKDMELPFSLSFHLSRHTFATNALANGMRIEYVSKLLDHATIQQTQVYAKIVSEELDNAVDKYVN